MRTPQQRRAMRDWRKADTGPSPGERQILAAIERTGGLLLQYRNGRELVSLADGSPVSRAFDVATAIEQGWLRPDPASPALLEGRPAQRYFATGFVSIEGGRQ